MRVFIMICMTLLLVACGTTDNQKNPSNSNSSKVTQLENQKESTVIEEDFILTLSSEKEQYKVGEELKIKAELTYTGEEEIAIGHGGSWLFMNTTNVTKGYEFGSAMIDPYIVTTMKPNIPIVERYTFSGGTYHEGMGGNKYSEKEFEQMSNMNFPPGQYKIEGVTEFVIDGQQQRYNLKTEIVFEVIE